MGHGGSQLPLLHVSDQSNGLLGLHEAGGHDFLEDWVKSLQSDEEFRKLITALLEQISAFEELALSEKLAEEEVAIHVNLALTAMRPMVGNYFGGILEGLVGRLRIKIHGDGSPPHSTQEGLEKHFAKVLRLSSTSPPALEGCGSWGLQVGYSLEFTDEGKGPQGPALSSTTLPNLLNVIHLLWSKGAQGSPWITCHEGCS